MRARWICGGTTLLLRNRSHLLQFDQRAAEILGVQEENRLSVGTDLRLAVAEHPRAFDAKLVASGKQILDLIAEMVHATARVAVEIAAHRRIGAEGLQQFDLAVG